VSRATTRGGRVGVWTPWSDVAQHQHGRAARQRSQGLAWNSHVPPRHRHVWHKRKPVRRFVAKSPSVRPPVGT